VVGETIEEQTRHTIEQMKICLSEVGASIKDVVGLFPSFFPLSRPLLFRPLEDSRACSESLTGERDVVPG